MSVPDKDEGEEERGKEKGEAEVEKNLIATDIIIRVACRREKKTTSK